MSSEVIIRLNPSGVRELLRSEEMQLACENQAEIIARKCGEGYEISAYSGKTRVNVSVRPKTAKAKRDNAENNTLWKALSP